MCFYLPVCNPIPEAQHTKALREIPHAPLDQEMSYDLSGQTLDELFLLMFLPCCFCLPNRTVTKTRISAQLPISTDL